MYPSFFRSNKSNVFLISLSENMAVLNLFNKENKIRTLDVNELSIDR
jgi:hypothetical protein